MLVLNASRLGASCKLAKGSEQFGFGPWSKTGCLLASMCLCFSYLQIKGLDFSGSTGTFTQNTFDASTLYQRVVTSRYIGESVCYYSTFVLVLPILSWSGHVLFLPIPVPIPSLRFSQCNLCGMRMRCPIWYGPTGTSDTWSRCDSFPRFSICSLLRPRCTARRCPIQDRFHPEYSTSIPT